MNELPVRSGRKFFFVARKETKHERSEYLVSPERTTRKSKAAEQRRYEVAGFSRGKRKE